MASEKIEYEAISLYMILFDIKQNDVSRETFIDKREILWKYYEWCTRYSYIIRRNKTYKHLKLELYWSLTY